MGEARVLLLFKRLYVFLAAGTKETQKNPRKMRFQVQKWHFEVEKIVNACVEMLCYVSPSAGICFTGNGLRRMWPRVLTGIFSYFQLFVPCTTGTAG